MSTPQEKNLNKGGRPPRAPGEKLQRVSFTLRPTVLLGLDVVARDRRESLSRAAEFLIEQSVRQYRVNPSEDIWSKIESFAAGWLAMFDHLLVGDVDIKSLDPKDQVGEAIKKIAECDKGRLLLMPSAVLNPVERYFSAVTFQAFEIAAEQYKDEPHIPMLYLIPVIEDAAHHAFTLCANFYQRGISINGAAEQLIDGMAHFEELSDLIKSEFLSGS